MPENSFYLAHELVRGYGRMWFLQVFHRADASGGADLLGSFVHRLGGPFNRYPEPLHMWTEQVVMRALEKNRDVVRIPQNEALVKRSVLPAVSQRISIAQSKAFQVGVSNIPNVPVSLGLPLDFDKLAQFTFSFAEARMEYIPTGYLANLYSWCDGNYRLLWPEIALPLDKQYIVDQVLIVRNPVMTFESTNKFDAELTAQVDLLNAKLGGTIKYSISDEKTLSATVLDGIDYLAGLKTTEWDELG